jgi:transposase
MTISASIGMVADYRPRRGARYDCGDGVLRTVQQIARHTNCDVSAVYARIAKGWTGQDLLRQRQTKLYDCGGERLSVKQISVRTGVSEATVYNRLARGLRGKELLMKKTDRRDRATPRSPGMVLACKLADAFPDRLPTTAEIRKLHPMAAQTAERWRTALRAAREFA